jgi:integrase
MARKNKKDRGLFERPKDSGVWWIRYHDHNGQERREKVGYKSDALSLYEERKTQVRRIKKGLAAADTLGGQKQRKLTLGEYLKSLEPELKTKGSWRDMKRFIKTWTRLIGQLPLEQVTRTHAKKRQTARLERGIAPATINREVAFLQARLQQATDEGLLVRNPLSGLKGLKENNISDRHLSEAEEERVKARMHWEDFELVEMAIHTGIRQDRLFNTAWKDVSFEDGGWIRVHKAKGGKFRAVPLTKRALEILKRRYECRKSAWVFPNSTNGNPINASNFYSRKFKPALEAAGIEGITWHRLRHTLGSRLALQGVSIQAISKILGHSSTQVTERYAHLMPDSYRAAIQTLDQEPSKGGLRVVK